MTLYALYRSSSEKVPAAVPERFSALAAILPPVFLLRHGLWLETAGWIVGVVALGAGARLIGDDAAFCLYVLLSVALGFAAPSLQRHALKGRGAHPAGYRVAASTELAQLEAMR